MKLLLLLLIITVQTLFFTCAGYIQDKLFNAKALKVVRLIQCPGTNLPHQLFIQLGKCNGRSALVNNITLLAKKNLKNKLKLTVSINRCRSRENLDSCEEYHNMRNLDFCQAISPDLLVPGVSNPLAVPFEPILKCPIKQGTYHAYNFTFKLTPFLLFNLDGWYWKLKGELFSSEENNKRVSCTYCEAYTQI